MEGHRWLSAARTLLAAVLGAAVAVALAGSVRAPIGPFDTTLLARPSLNGVSTVRLAPLGTIELDTHAGPVRVVLRVEELRPDEAERIARNPDVLHSLEDEIAGDARDALVGLLVRVVAVSTLGGGLGALVLARRTWRSAIAGTAAGALVAGLVAAGTVATFQPEAVAEPRYSGLLAAAPNAVGDVGSIIERFNDYRVQLAELVGNVATLYQAGQALPDLEPGANTIRVLHVSDIHNNPQAFDLMEQLIDQFGLEAVIDSGDLTDWGTEPESRLIGQIADLGVPYVWVRGNHDSRRTQRAVAAQPNAVVLDGETVEVVGLQVWGIGDPRFTPDKSEPANGVSEQDQATAFAGEVFRELRSSGPVDVAVVHDARIAADLGDAVPLVLAGHTHQPREAQIGKATLLVEGSTGGAGLRGLQGEDPHPLTASILYFDPASRQLVAYDRVTIDGVGSAGVRIERHRVEGRGEAEAVTGQR